MVEYWKVGLVTPLVCRMISASWAFCTSRLRHIHIRVLIHDWHTPVGYKSLHWGLTCQIFDNLKKQGDACIWTSFASLTKKILLWYPIYLHGDCVLSLPCLIAVTSSMDKFHSTFFDATVGKDSPSHPSDPVIYNPEVLLLDFGGRWNAISICFSSSQVLLDWGSTEPVNSLYDAVVTALQRDSCLQLVRS